MGKEEELKHLFSKQRESKLEPINQNDLNGLPSIVQRYFQYSGVIGKYPIQTVALRQKGYFRLKENQEMMPMRAEQYYTTNPPSFIWYGQISPIPLIPIKARDQLINGLGSMEIKLLGLIKLGEEKGIEMNQASLTRYLSEAIWFPTALLENHVSWAQIDENQARVTIEHSGVQSSGVFHFNERGQILNFVTERYSTEEGKLVLRPWSTPIQGYKEINGFNIPYKGDAVWHIDGREFKYIEVEITDIKYT
jgi:hypothetical protein